MLGIVLAGVEYLVEKNRKKKKRKKIEEEQKELVLMTTARRRRESFEYFQEFQYDPGTTR